MTGAAGTPANLKVLTAAQANWFASIINIGAVTGALLGGPLGDKLGRRTTLGMMSAPYALGWLGVALLKSPTVLILLRVLLGICMGALSVVVPVYLNEISPKHLTGLVGSLNQLSIVVGVLLVNILGGFAFDFVGQGAGKLCQWKNLALTGLGLSLSLLSNFAMPESPSWLARHSTREATEAALNRLRSAGGSKEAESLLAEVRGDGKEAGRSAGSSTASKPLTAYPKSLVISIFLMVFQQFIGINSIIFYTSKICSDAGMKDASLGTLGAFGSMIVATAISSGLMDKAGRRPLLLGSSASMLVSTLLLAYYFIAQDQFHGKLFAPSWLALGALVMYLIAYSFGFGPIPWLIFSEIFPTEVRSQGGTLCTAINWLCSFLVTLSFGPMQKTLGRGGGFGFYSAVLAASFAFVLGVVPETSGKSMDEVLKILGTKSPKAPAVFFT
eukprot:gnl/TRDRNA2_/TRDRNA2_163787_c1_seq1.p1 gnl/TRDRNA2_/TRDRNA2_163787_c1~~gnl/TRDRNA2_/TRDRNA2_163787_c1_seq1.p1  ORF type:complete len:507 (-),score=62.14 gnl/TRDRNA2_/TRDRNA2_163787_c1_seq1:236-1564(-)